MQESEGAENIGRKDDRGGSINPSEEMAAKRNTPTRENSSLS